MLKIQLVIFSLYFVIVSTNGKENYTCCDLLSTEVSSLKIYSDTNFVSFNTNIPKPVFNDTIKNTITNLTTIFVNMKNVSVKVEKQMPNIESDIQDCNKELKNVQEYNDINNNINNNISVVKEKIKLLNETCGKADESWKNLRNDGPNLEAIKKNFVQLDSIMENAKKEKYKFDKLQNDVNQIIVPEQSCNSSISDKLSEYKNTNEAVITNMKNFIKNVLHNVNETKMKFLSNYFVEDDDIIVFTEEDFEGIWKTIDDFILMSGHNLNDTSTTDSRGNVAKTPKKIKDNIGRKETIDILKSQTRELQKMSKKLQQIRNDMSEKKDSLADLLGEKELLINQIDNLNKIRQSVSQLKCAKDLKSQ